MADEATIDQEEETCTLVFGVEPPDRYFVPLAVGDNEPPHRVESLKVKGTAEAVVVQLNTGSNLFSKLTRSDGKPVWINSGLVRWIV
jgi:hypothetical protein